MARETRPVGEPRGAWSLWREGLGARNQGGEQDGAHLGAAPGTRPGSAADTGVNIRTFLSTLVLYKSTCSLALCSGRFVSARFSIHLAARTVQVISVSARNRRGPCSTPVTNTAQLRYQRYLRGESWRADVSRCEHVTAFADSFVAERGSSRNGTAHSRACWPLAAAKRRTRRVAGSIERRRRHERCVVVPTSE